MSLTRDAAPRGDADDVRRAAAGDSAAFERLYRAHVARIFSLAGRMIGPEDAEDATQEVFIRAWEKLGSFRGDAGFGTWLHRLAINHLLSRRAARSRRRDREQDIPAVIEAAPGRRAETDLQLDFEAAIAQLPDGAREVFVLHDIEGVKHREIAEQLGVTEGTTKAQLHRARMTLRQYLDR
jgi:RNA polymerase sigma-70 factor (ECF subfamily)